MPNFSDIKFIIVFDGAIRKTNIIYIGITLKTGTIRKKIGLSQKKMAIVFRVSQNSYIFALDFPLKRSDMWRLVL